MISFSRTTTNIDTGLDRLNCHVAEATHLFTTTGNPGWKDKMWPKIVEVTGTAA